MNKLKSLVLITSACVFSLLAISAYSEPEHEEEPAWKKQTNEFLENWRTRYGISEIAVSIASAREGRSNDFYSGFSLHNNLEKSGPKHLFIVGDLSKFFISALTLKFSEWGELKLDDTVSKWFPEYPRWGNITVQQLLNMTSGMYNYSDALNAKVEANKKWKTKELLGLAYEHPDYAEPGKNWNFSDTNYVLAANLLERITKKPMTMLFNYQFAERLGTKNSYFIEGAIPITILKRLSQGAYKNAKQIEDISSLGYSGVVISNSQDLLLFFLNVYYDNYLNNQFRSELKKTVKIPENSYYPPDTRYGLGMFVTKTPQLGEIYWDTDVTEGYISMMAWIPKAEIIITATGTVGKEVPPDLLAPNKEFFKKIINILYSSPLWKKEDEEEKDKEALKETETKSEALQVKDEELLPGET